MTATVSRISYGFLTGNFDGDIDANATATAWREALEARFPGAKVEVRYQNAQGSKPYPLKTFVEFTDGEVECESDGHRGACDEVADVLEKVEPIWASVENS